VATSNADREILTPQEVCDRYKVNLRWIDRRIEAGDIKPLKAGRLNRFFLDEIESYLEREREAVAR
jgi:excisionase family DNA binding protein